MVSGRNRGLNVPPFSETALGRQLLFHFVLDISWLTLYFGRLAANGSARLTRVLASEGTSNSLSVREKSSAIRRRQVDAATSGGRSVETSRVHRVVQGRGVLVTI